MRRASRRRTRTPCNRGKCASRRRSPAPGRGLRPTFEMLEIRAKEGARRSSLLCVQRRTDARTLHPRLCGSSGSSATAPSSPSSRRASLLATSRCGTTCRLRRAFVFARAYGSRNPASIEFRQPHRHELAAGHIGQSANRECTEAASAGPSIDGWLRFRAWNCTSESPIGGASSWSSR